MTNLSAKARVTFGLVGLTVSVLLMAAMLDLVPDRVGAVRDGRTALAEVLAASSSGWLGSSELRLAEDTVRLAVERNPDLLSAAMRRRDGQAVLTVGEHDGRWQAMSGEYSSESQIRVPILAGEKRWGELELRFRPLSGTGLAALLGHPLVVLVAFMAVAGFFSFYVYLSKALTQLDPSRAVPGRVRSALDTMAEGLLVIERNGRIVLANRAFATLVGVEPDTLVGTQPADLAFEGSGDAGESAPRFPWIRALETGAEEYDVPMRLRDAQGTCRALMVNCSPVLGASGRPGGVLVSFDDVTELEARGEQLREAKDEADAANRAKSEFLANMSHEIRTPMNAILGFTEVLRRGYQRDDGESRKYLNTIHSSGTHLLDLINDILDLSKVESGRMEIERVPVAAHRIIQEVVRVLAVKAREKGIDLQFQPDGPLPETVLSDPARLRQIVTNLVGNAIKFTDRGTVRVTARLTRAGQEPRLEIQVRDSGIGIAADKLEAVFEAFAQADSSVTRRYGGTGLGLPISRKFARAMGGDITVASVPGKGSTFTVHLATGALDDVPMLAPEDVARDDQVVAETGGRRWSFSSARVLVVDDAPENRALLQVVLEGTGIELHQAEDGRQALDLAGREDFDLVLMDMQMPVMDGYTATRRLREQGFRAPVLALTAHAMKGYEQECRAAGCDDFITKPIDIDRIVERLAHWLPDKARVQEPSAGAAPVAAPQHGGPAAGTVPDDAQPLVSTLAGQERMHGVLRTFAQRLDAQLALMRSASSRGDLDALAELAHWLKGSAGTVGFGAFTEPARLLEEGSRGGDAAAAARSLTTIEALASRVQVPGAREGGGSGQPPPAAARERPAAPAADEPPAPVLSALAGNPRMQGVLRMFAQSLHQRLAALSDPHDLDELAQFAHWLKGSGGTVGFAQFTEPARELEQRARGGDAGGASQALTRVRDLAGRIQVAPAPDAPGGQAPAPGQVSPSPADLTVVAS